MVDRSQQTWCLYLILNAAGHSYIGITKGETPDQRIAMHNANKGAKRTKGQGPWKLIYTESGFQNRSEAQSREWHIKHNRSLKQKIIREHS